MSNPFESGHIKNYVSLYVGVVVIMALFFIASSLFIDAQKVEKKVFNAEVKEKMISKDLAEKNTTRKFKLMDSSY